MLAESKIVHVGIADIKTGRAPEVLRTTLGSCLGIVLYDPDLKIGGISHIMLAKDTTSKDSKVHPYKYGESALPALIKMMSDLGSNPGAYTARIFGGASMFKGLNSTFLQNIGEANIEIAREFLAKNKVPLVLEDVGGHDGRTISLYMDDGRILLKKSGVEKYLYKVR